MAFPSLFPPEPFLARAKLTPRCRWIDPAREAYNSALEILKKELTTDEYQMIWLRKQSSMQDVQKAVVDAMKEYDGRSKGSKARMWLASCSARVMHYSCKSG